MKQINEDALLVLCALDGIYYELQLDNEDRLAIFSYICKHNEKKNRGNTLVLKPKKLFTVEQYNRIEKEK